MRQDRRQGSWLAALVTRLSVQVLAEGRYGTSADVRRALDAAHAGVVAGNAITSPYWITRNVSRK